MAVAEHVKDPVGYLIRRGWTCDGDSYSKGARWVDPTRPKVEAYGTKFVMKQKTAKGITQDIFQTTCDPAVVFLGQIQAVGIQRIRDRDAETKMLENAKKTKKTPEPANV